MGRGVGNRGQAASSDVGMGEYMDVTNMDLSKTNSNGYLNLDSLSGSLGVAARRDALEAQYLEIARRESHTYLAITGEQEHNNSQLAFPVGTPSKRKPARGGLLATIENPVWFGFAVIVLMIFSLTLFGIGITFIYADKADGWENTNFGAVGAYAGVPLLVFGVAFLVATLFAARDFYRKSTKSGSSGFLSELSPQSRRGSQYTGRNQI